MKKIFLLLLLAATTNIFFAQSFDTLQRKSILLTNAVVHVGNGTVYENGVLGFENGKITLVGDATTMRYDQSKFAEIINCSGKHIYPGIIGLNTPLGLREIDAARATNDAAETGALNPNVRSIISYNADSKSIPTVRSNGILIAQVVPDGGIISGTSSVVELDAWNWQDAAYKTDNGMHVHWPNYFGYDFIDGNFQVTLNKNYSAEVQNLKTFFDEAKAYCTQQKHEVKNLKFEAMRSVFSGETKLYMYAQRAKEMMSAVQFAAQYELTPVIIGAREAYLITDYLKQHNISIILENIHSLPASDDEDIQMPYKLPAVLQKAGVEFAISLSYSQWNMRNLPFMAGTAVNFGLPKEQALQSITLTPAKILGIDKTLGSLEAGKDATLLICAGDVLDMKTSKVERAFISGREIELQNWQYENYEKYSKKYGIEVK